MILLGPENKPLDTPSCHLDSCKVPASHCLSQAQSPACHIKFLGYGACRQATSPCPTLSPLWVPSPSSQHHDWSGGLCALCHLELLYSTARHSCRAGVGAWRWGGREWTAGSKLPWAVQPCTLPEAAWGQEDGGRNVARPTKGMPKAAMARNARLAARLVLYWLSPLLPRKLYEMGHPMVPGSRPSNLRQASFNIPGPASPRPDTGSLSLCVSYLHAGTGHAWSGLYHRASREWTVAASIAYRCPVAARPSPPRMRTAGNYLVVKSQPASSGLGGPVPPVPDVTPWPKLLTQQDHSWERHGGLFPSPFEASVHPPLPIT